MDVLYHFKAKHASVLINSFKNLYVKNRVICYVIMYYHDFNMAREILKNPNKLIDLLISNRETMGIIKWKPNEDDLKTIKLQPEFEEFREYFVNREWMLCRIIGVKLKLDRFIFKKRDHVNEQLLEQLKYEAPNDVIMPKLSTKFEKIPASKCEYLDIKKINPIVMKFLIKHCRVNIKNFTENGKIKTLRYMTTQNDVFENMKFMKHMLIRLKEINEVE